MTPEFLDGPISKEYREILESESFFETAPSPKADTGGGTKCKSEPLVCPKPDTEGTKCKSDITCPKKIETGGTKCKSDEYVCKKKHSIAASVPGWSLPPAPLS